MLYTVREFCSYVQDDLNGLIDEVAGITRYVSDEEKKAYASSYPVVASMLAQAMKRQPAIGDAHISTTELLLEYKLPAASAWCDLVLLGANAENRKEVIIVELKNYQKNQDDAPGSYEGLMMHKGSVIKHPADQVKGYTEYCRRFHSVVLDEGAEVNGCVYFTQPIDLQPYRLAPNDRLTSEYPMYNTESSDHLAEYVTSKICKGDEAFAASFVNGFYKQDRNILRQIAENLSANSATARPFVLLDEQRLGFNLVMQTLEQRVKDGKKEVIVVQGPPGSGKSAVAINLWIESVMKYSKKKDCGNIVFVTTSGSQNDNWSEIFNYYGYKYHASDLILKANEFNPGLSGGKMKNELLPLMEQINPDYVSDDKENSLKYEYFEDYLKYMIEHDMTRNYKDNLHFLSVVDEAHALINPVAKGFRSNKPAGWCFQMGPQVYHIIRESQVSVFFTDGKQSFRDNETTRIEDIEKWAKKLDAEFTLISLEDMQFRCAGSKEYVDWIDGLFTENPLRNVLKWKDKFHVRIVDYPSDMEADIRAHMAKGDKSCRILSSYTRKWESMSDLAPLHDADADYDFDLADKDGKRWLRYWNNPNGYAIYVQGAGNSMMHQDPLSEVGCPYVVRGFDFDYVGLLWLEDIYVRNGKWYVSIRHNKETATVSSRKRAKDEQEEAIKNKLIKGKKKDIDEVPGFDPRFPAAHALFETVAQAYRILLTRAIKGVTIYIKDEETRAYVRELLNGE